MTTYNPAALPELVALLEEIERCDERFDYAYAELVEDQRPRRQTALALARQHPSTTCPVCSYPFAQPYCPRCDAVALAGQLCTHCYTCGRLYPASGACPSDHSELAQARERIAELERLASELLDNWLQTGSRHADAQEYEELLAEVNTYRTRLQS